jgi:hypothetical protein
MKRTFFLLLTIVCISNGLKAQLSEKFLKLNRVVVLDSVKSKIFNTNGNSETIFSITVPAGVYWKIESINFNFLTNQNFLDGLEPRVKINSTILTFTIGTGIYTTWGGFFSKTTPTWAGPGSTINMYTTNNYVYNNGKVANFDMALSAMEFILE